MSDETTPDPDTNPVPARPNRKPKDVATDQEIADSMYFLGEGEWRELHEDD